MMTRKPKNPMAKLDPAFEEYQRALDIENEIWALEKKISADYQIPLDMVIPAGYMRLVKRRKDTNT